MAASDAFFRRIGSRSRSVDGAAGPKCLIVHHVTFGMRHDGLVLGQAIRSRFPGADLIVWEIPEPVLRQVDGRRLLTVPAEFAGLLPFDFVFFLEHLRPVPMLWDSRFARKRVLVPNPEWLSDLDEQLLLENGVDALLLKNSFGADMIGSEPFMATIPLNRVVGWSSLDLKANGNPSEPDFERVLHVRGQSPQKQTNVLMKLWHERPHFPVLDVLCTTGDGFRFPAPAMIGGNLRITLGALADGEIRSVQRAMGIHVFPSAAEGFGHALNEARAAGAVLVTTGAAPMRDLVEDGVSGILIRVREENRGTMGRSVGYRLLEEDIAAAIERALGLSLEQRRAMGRAARAAFLADREAFQDKLAAVLAELG